MDYSNEYKPPHNIDSEGPFPYIVITLEQKIKNNYIVQLNIIICNNIIINVPYLHKALLEMHNYADVFNCTIEI